MALGRRDFCKLVSASALLASPLGRAFAAERAAADQFFVFIHAAGGWDVTLWADPRNERKGIVEPASTDNTDTSAIRRWKDATLDGNTRTFTILQPPNSNLSFGPGIGDLFDLHDRLCLINGLAMNTVSHPDGTAYSATGRHLQGTRTPQASVNTIVANELGLGQTLPSVSVNFPSAFAGENLDRRASPLQVERIGSISRALARAGAWDSADDRQAVTTLLSDEARSLATHAEYPDVLQGLSLQLGGLQGMLSSEMQDVFNEGRLKTLHPEFNFKARFHGGTALDAAFAVEAMKRNLVRCVSFAAGGFDTHVNNYRFQAQVQQEMFDMVAVLVRALDATPHPTRQGAKLADHTHILVFSDFCRTPQINIGGGRDHYPNNSALVISPRFKGNFRFGKSDVEQLLPAEAKKFSDGQRPIAPPDLLATFLAALNIEPRKYLRDGETVPELLRA
jgi:hypothetical protein